MPKNLDQKFPSHKVYSFEANFSKMRNTKILRNWDSNWSRLSTSSGSADQQHLDDDEAVYEDQGN